MVETKYGTFAELIDIAVVELRPLLERLREIILEIDPAAVEVVRLGDRAATYGLGPKKMSEGYVYIMPHSKWVNLGFYKGADLPDPERLLQGTGKKLRHIKVHSLAEAERPAVYTLIKEAQRERREALGR